MRIGEDRKGKRGIVHKMVCKKAVKYKPVSRVRTGQFWVKWKLFNLENKK